MKHVVGMLGLGDNIYQRAVIREMGQVSLATPWPQIYADLPVRPVRVVTSLRTQSRNVADWHRWPRPIMNTTDKVHLGYGADPELTILQSLLKTAHMPQDMPLTFDLPSFKSPWSHARPYVVVRPSTVRKEWPAGSRNPHRGYINRAALAAQKAGYSVISVAHLEEGEEWPDDVLPPCNAEYLHGQIPLTDLLGMVQHARGVIGGVGWLLPAALAYRVPMLCLWGGWGLYNGPQRVLDPRLDTTRLVQAVPERLCMCEENGHSCDKTIPNLEERISEFLGLLGSPRAGVAA